MHRKRLAAALAALAATLACAEASAPLPPAVEVLLVVHQTPAAVSVIPVGSPTTHNSIPLGGGMASPTTLSARNGWAVVPLGDEADAAVVDLRTSQVTRMVPLPGNSGATGAAMVDDSIAYVANPNLNSVTRVNYLTGDTASVAVGASPMGVVFTRGKVFVLNANLNGANPAGPSWVSVVDPVTNRLATGIDSISLPLPGNASYSDVAHDGLLYVMNAGPADGTTDSRLSLVDPVGRQELGNFKGFGNDAGALANNGAGRLFISSRSEGLMIFDLISRQVLRGAGNGLPIPDNSGVAVDGDGRIYALEAGTCPGGTGKVHILRANLSVSRVVDADPCPVAAVITEIPPQ
jgi:hypothetical protein